MFHFKRNKKGQHLDSGIYDVATEKSPTVSKKFLNDEQACWKLASAVSNDWIWLSFDL